MPGFFAAFTSPDRLARAIDAIGPALLGGFLPALIWLAFWLREDRERPEPRRIVITTFLLGAATIPAALVIQKIASEILIGGTHLERAAQLAPLATLLTLAAWVIAEEAVKVLAAYAGGLSRRAADEPIDGAVYLIAAALGFSALENGLYFFGRVFFENFSLVAAIGDASTRAVGATTLHVANAALLGVFAGYARYATPRVARALWVTGFALAVLLHLAYNALIIFGDGSQATSAAAFAISWAVSLAAILALEKVKAMRVESGQPEPPNTEESP
jgi:RsiW-degrading membrane proteinase PrsW (M82 family)